MRLLYNLLTFYFLCLIYSCNNSNKDTLSQNHLEDIDTAIVIDSLELSKYFETDDIKIDTAKRNINVTINNSKLILDKKKKMGIKWENSEPWISVAATYQVKTIDTNIDSLIYNVKIEDSENQYSYSIKQLKQANTYLSTCWGFVKCLNNNDYLAIKELLSPEIIAKYNDIQIENFIRSTFGKNLISRTELIGTKIVKSKYSFYINFWDIANNSQTYTFSFLEGNNKIAGMQIVK